MNRWGRWILLASVLAIHGIVLLTVTITTRQQEQREDPTVFKMVDVDIERPPAPPPPPPEPREPDTAPTALDGPAENVIETEDEVVTTTPPPAETVFLPQHRISVPPQIPTDEIRSRVRYPAMANRQGIEGVVYLELFINERGEIERIEILREPGFGLGEAAAAAFDGVTVSPAEANGQAVAVRFRYPVRFELR